MSQQLDDFNCEICGLYFRDTDSQGRKRDGTLLNVKLPKDLAISKLQISAKTCNVCAKEHCKNTMSDWWFERYFPNETREVIGLTREDMIEVIMKVGPKYKYDVISIEKDLQEGSIEIVKLYYDNIARLEKELTEETRETRKLTMNDSPINITDDYDISTRSHEEDILMEFDRNARRDRL